MHFAIVIVPIMVDFDIFFSCIIHRDIIVFFKGVNQVVCIIAGGVFDTKVVDNKCEIEGARVMFPQGPGTM
jgi:hypothetical protein